MIFVERYDIIKLKGVCMKKKLILAISVASLLSLFSFLIFSCASGTVLVTGTQRPATNADEVVVYTEAPEKYEVIGIVTASSDAGWTAQGSLDYAIAELKKQAAKIGANGVIVESVGTSNSGGVIMYGIFVPATTKNVSGKAIFVESDAQ